MENMMTQNTGHRLSCWMELIEYVLDVNVND